MKNLTKRKAKEYYASIGRVWCPALNDYVIFNSIGFNHLIRKRGILRAGSEQKRRLNLLADAVDMIANPGIEFSHDKKCVFHVAHRGNEKLALTTSGDFWKFVQEKDNKIVKVIIRQFEGGSKHFFSVYAREQKTAH